MPNMLSTFFKKGNKKEEAEEQRRLEEDSRRAREAREALEQRTVIISKVYAELWRAVKNQDSGPKRFVCYSDLSRIWDYSRVIVPLAQGLDWCDTASLSQAKENFIRVMSTLVWIGWNSWGQFGSLFLHHKNARGVRNRTDKDLPFKDTSFLHTDPLRISFKDEQYIFNPMVIIEDDPEEESEYVEYSEQDRLPFSRTESIGRGGAGTVTKEEIPPLYFGFKNGAFNSRPMYVARKCFPGAGQSGGSFEVEQKNLKAFKKCLNQNGNIMQSFTAFLHGSDFNIISPLADLDLHTYFEGSYDDFHIRSRCFSPAHLLYGAACLAGALRFLHEGLQPVSIAEKIYCAHLDLKPENILVIWPRGSNPPAGRWLVHDFGTSKIKESRNAPASRTKENHDRRTSKDLVAPGDFIRQFSLTKASRTPGPFQAPEVRNSEERVVGTESDIWSLGCILAQVLTFALGGPSFVSQLAQSTYEGFDNDYFYDATHEDFALKPPVIQYLDSLLSIYQDNIWIRETLRLIYRMLVKEPHMRPSAKAVQDTLERVYTRQDTSILELCSWANENVPMALPVPVPQVRQAQQLLQQQPQRPPEPYSQQQLLQRQQQQSIDPHQRYNRPVQEPQHLPQRPEPEPLHSRPSLPQVIVRSPTAANGAFEDQPGLEVVVSQASSPRSESLRNFERDSIQESRIPHNNLSRNSSTSTRPVSLTEDVTFIRLLVPKNTFKSIICPDSCHVAFISKKQTSIMRILDEDWVKNPKGPIINAGYLQACTKDNPDSFDWVDGCMSGQHIVLRAKRTNGREHKVYRYKFNDSGHVWNEEPIVDTANLTSTALDIAVSVWGDVLFICDDRLLYYSTKYGFLSVATTGRHRIGSARFGPDGLCVFAWSHEPGVNHFYKWDTTQHQWTSRTDHSRTLKRIWHIKELPKSPERAGFGTPTMYPFNNYFVAFDRPDRVLTVGQHDSNPSVTEVQRGARDIIGGASVQVTLLEKKIKSLVLLQNNSSLLMTLPMMHYGAGNPSEGVKLKLKFNADSDALAVFKTGSNFYLVVSHSDGRIERRRVSSA